MNDALKIVIVSTQRGWYGGEQQLWLLANGLRSRGHEVHFVARSRGELARRMREHDFPVSDILGNGRNLIALWQTRRHLRRIRPDILHYNDSHALTVAGTASLGLRIPARIATRHVDRAIHSPRRFRAFCDRIHCVAGAVATACEQAGIPREMLRVIHASTDPKTVQAGDRIRGRRASQVADDEWMILVVASLYDHKGHAFLLDAMPALLARQPKSRLILAGDGPEKKSLMRRVDALNLSQSVSFLGYRRDVPDLIQAADLIVLPSLVEGLPVTLMDAMFAGTAVVATAASGTPELLVNEPNGDSVGWLVPVADSKALAVAMLDALEHPEEKQKRACLARCRAEQSFTAELMVEKTIAAYREVLARRPLRSETRLESAANGESETRSTSRRVA